MEFDCSKCTCELKPKIEQRKALWKLHEAYGSRALSARLRAWQPYGPLAPALKRVDTETAQFLQNKEQATLQEIETVTQEIEPNKALCQNPRQNK